MMTTHNSAACPRFLTHSTLGHTQRFWIRSSVPRGEGKKSQKAKNITDLEFLLQTDRYPETVNTQGVRFNSLFLQRKKRGGEDQKKPGLPWVRSSGNYSLTWKRRQLISVGKAQCPPQNPPLASLISVFQDTWNCDTMWASKSWWTTLNYDLRWF